MLDQYTDRWAYWVERSERFSNVKINTTHSHTHVAIMFSPRRLCRAKSNVLLWCYCVLSCLCPLLLPPLLRASSYSIWVFVCSFALSSFLSLSLPPRPLLCPGLSSTPGARCRPGTTTPTCETARGFGTEWTTVPCRRCGYRSRRSGASLSITCLSPVYHLSIICLIICLIICPSSVHHLSYHLSIICLIIGLSSVYHLSCHLFIIRLIICLSSVHHLSIICLSYHLRLVSTVSCSRPTGNPE